MAVLGAAGNSPLLYYTLFRFSRSYRRQDLVVPTTDICIEGPPGSGNTYIVTALSLSNPEARIAHHHHVRAQLHRARRLNIPAISLLRDPIECALSRASSWGTPQRSDLVLRLWLRFFSNESLIRYSILVGFKTLTSSLGTVMDAVNSRYNTDFVTETPSPEAVFEEMDRRRLERFGEVGDNPNRPDPRRGERPEAWRSYVEGLPGAAEARRRYEALNREAL